MINPNEIESVNSSAEKVGLPGLQTARLRAKMTQEDLAHRVGVRLLHISRIENGKRNASQYLIQLLARLLKCSADELLGTEAQAAS